MDDAEDITVRDWMRTRPCFSDSDQSTHLAYLNQKYRKTCLCLCKDKDELTCKHYQLVVILSPVLHAGDNSPIISYGWCHLFRANEFFFCLKNLQWGAFNSGTPIFVLKIIITNAIAMRISNRLQFKHLDIFRHRW